MGTENPSKIGLILAGGTAGIIAKTACAPLERIKILNQLGQSHGLLTTFRGIFTAEGLKGFWKGNFTNCIRVFPSKGILFAANDFYRPTLRKYVQSDSDFTKNWTSVLAGSMSGCTAVICTYPLDLTRTRISSKIGANSRHHKIGQSILLTVREEGFLGLYKGIGPTLAGALPFEGIKFGVYDFLSRTLIPEDKQDSILWKLAAGAGAGLAAQFVMFPNDTVRRRMQLQGSDGSARLYKTALHCYYELFSKNGIRIFYRGMSTNIIRSVPNTAIQFASFEVLKSFLIPEFTGYLSPSD